MLTYNYFCLCVGDIQRLQGIRQWRKIICIVKTNLSRKKPTKNRTCLKYKILGTQPTVSSLPTALNRTILVDKITAPQINRVILKDPLENIKLLVLCHTIILFHQNLENGLFLKKPYFFIKQDQITLKKISKYFVFINIIEENFSIEVDIDLFY